MPPPVAGVSKNEGSSNGAAEKKHSWLGAIPIGIAFIFLSWLGWRKWPDALIDFGQQLYLPWRISRGALLYHDLAYVYGCLSVCYHAVLFKLFGVSLNVVLASNFAIVILLFMVVYGLFLKCSDGLTATIMGLAITVLACGQFLDVGNYNYICPYSHEELHGIVLSILMMACLARWLLMGRKLPLALAGGCVGLVFMTKPELFVAAVATFVVAVAFQCYRTTRIEPLNRPLTSRDGTLSPAGGEGRCEGAVSSFEVHEEVRVHDDETLVVQAKIPSRQPSPRWAGRGRWINLYRFPQLLLLALVCALMPLAGFFAFFRSEMGSADALKAVCGAWMPLLHSTAIHVPIYQRTLGLDRPMYRIGQMLLEFGGLAVIVGLCAWRLTRPAVTSLERVLFFVIVGGISINYGWQNAGHALPLLVIVAAILLFFEWFMTAPGNECRLIFPTLWVVFSFVMLAKLGLYPRISYFGVFLAMPAFVSAIYLLLYLLPRFLEAFGLDSKAFRAAMLILLLMGLARLTIQSALFFKDKDFTLGAGGDRIVTYNPRVDPTGAAMALADIWIEKNTAPTNTLAVIPEGVMLNYLTRRDNPTPYVVFAFEVWAFGEQNMLNAYKKHPPDYIVLIQRDSSEYGHPFFGADKGYGYDFMQWVRENYESVYLAGKEPLKTGAFGIQILQYHPGVSTNEETPVQAE
jgi:hypothetical protein